jgi:hypothetical protein
MFWRSRERYTVTEVPISTLSDENGSLLDPNVKPKKYDFIDSHYLQFFLPQEVLFS